MSNYIPLFYMDVITYPFPNPYVGSANGRQWKGPGHQLWHYCQFLHDDVRFGMYALTALFV